MYPLLDLITEQGSSGLGELFFFVSLEPTLRTSQWTRLSSPNNLFKNSSMRSPRVLILPSQKSISKYWTALFSSRSGSMAQKKRSSGFSVKYEAIDDNTYVFALFSSGAANSSEIAHRNYLCHRIDKRPGIRSQF